jgi:hypothetical protein
MRNILILSVAIIASLAIAGCQTAETQTGQNTGVANTASTPANAAQPAASPTAAPAIPPSDLKPEDISLDKPFPADELRNAVFGDEEAWKGKEVAVTGDYNGHSTSKLASGDKYSINVQGKERKVVIHCDGRKAPPEDVKTKREGRVFKGTVAIVNKAWQQVTLEPCEITN